MYVLVFMCSLSMLVKVTHSSRWTVDWTSFVHQFGTLALRVTFYCHCIVYSVSNLYLLSLFRAERVVSLPWVSLSDTSTPILGLLSTSSPLFTFISLLTKVLFVLQESVESNSLCPHHILVDLSNKRTTSHFLFLFGPHAQSWFSRSTFQELL